MIFQPKPKTATTIRKAWQIWLLSCAALYAALGVLGAIVGNWTMVGTQAGFAVWAFSCWMLQREADAWRQRSDLWRSLATEAVDDLDRLAALSIRACAVKSEPKASAGNPATDEL